ncbi:13713_t:CDS:2, partial [Funneliformis geosporum]
ENVIVFANKICDVNPDGNYTQIGLEWPKIVAATTYCNFIYAIHPDGFIYKISTSSYTNVFKWAEAGGGWERAKAIFTYNDHICIVRDSICLDGMGKTIPITYDVYLTIVDTNTGLKHVIHKNWNSKLA